VHEEFSEVPVIKMLKVWCELQQICGLEPSEEKEGKTIKDCEKNTLLIQSILNLINQEIWKFSESLHEEFPQIQICEMLSIWCKLQQICGFEFPDKPLQSAVLLQDEDLINSLAEEMLPSIRKTCEHVYIKGRNANTQFKTKVKWSGKYCSKHNK